MKKIAIITSTRAEFGLLLPIIQQLRKYESSVLKIELVVTGTHLSKDYGMTVNEIKGCSVRIDHEIIIPAASKTAYDISNNQVQALLKFTELFSEQKYNAVLILGDRYEMLAVAIAAVNTKTVIFHISGGDITEGAIDDSIRHCITKMSYIHFPSNEDSRKRIIQLGEAPERVFNYGSTSIDNALNAATLSKKEALESIGLTDKNSGYALCTYHPVTLGDSDIDWQIQEFLEAIKNFPSFDFIITKSNADQGGGRINTILDSVHENNIHVFASLGVKRYLSLMKYSLFVLGNSSSGIVEAAAFHVPVVNIGDRQRGRLQTENIINCKEDRASIISAINLALSPEMKDKCVKINSPYGNGTAAERIAKKVIEAVRLDNFDMKKKFYNIEVQE